MTAQYSHFCRLRAAYVNLLSEIDWQYALTLNFNAPVTDVSATSAMRKFCARLDRKLLGKSWAEKDPNERILVIVRCENRDKNFHLHGIAQLPASRRSINFCDLGEKAWRRVSRRGSACIRHRQNDQGWAQYITKQMTPGTEGDFIYSRDFMR